MSRVEGNPTETQIKSPKERIRRTKKVGLFFSALLLGGGLSHMVDAYFENEALHQQNPQIDSADATAFDFKVEFDSAFNERDIGQLELLKERIPALSDALTTQEEFRKETESISGEAFAGSMTALLGLMGVVVFSSTWSKEK